MVFSTGRVRENDTWTPNKPGLKPYKPVLRGKLPTTGLSTVVLLAFAVLSFPISGLSLPESTPAVKEKNKTDTYVIAEHSGDVDNASNKQDSSETEPENQVWHKGRRDENSSTIQQGSLIDWVWVFTSILIVIGLLLLFLYLLRRFIYRPPGAMAAGGEFEMLRQFHLGPKKSICLVRVWDRLFLLGVTETSITRLMEVTDPEEVANLQAQLKSSHRVQGKQFREIYQDLVGKFKK